jgi:catechol 2,3-dioxygenase-like lactoylglutathione lyase family enzyme
MTVIALDHLVLTVRDVDATCAWYERVLGMQRVIVDGDHVALHFGSQKINLHAADSPRAPHALVAKPGTADLCFLTELPLVDLARGLEREGVPIEHGPVTQPGARGAMESVYVRDPDGNLVEIARYGSPAS